MTEYLEQFLMCPFVGHGCKSVTDEGLYAELQRFHRSTEMELDDLEWKENWNEKDSQI